MSLTSVFCYSFTKCGQIPEQMDRNEVKTYKVQWKLLQIWIFCNRWYATMCFEVIRAESMKPSKLIWHLDTQYPPLQHISVEFLQRKLKALHDQQTSIFKATWVNKICPCLKLLTGCFWEIPCLWRKICFYVSLL